MSNINMQVQNNCHKVVKQVIWRFTFHYLSKAI